MARQVVQAHERGYQAALGFAGEAADGARAWAVEGTGSYGAGLARCLAERGETVLEVSRSPRSERRLRGKDDALDAVRTGGQCLPVTSSRFHETGSNGRRCDSYWSHVAAPSTSAAKR